jgi:NAD kinase
MVAVAPRAVVVFRRTEYEALVDRHGTPHAAEFFLRTRGRAIEDVRRQHDTIQDALVAVGNSIPMDWRRARVERSDLDRFQFDPEDIVVAVGQDGLVANVAKYLDGQPVIGVNPEPGVNPGVLVPHTIDAIGPLLVATVTGRAALAPRTMVEAVTDDGQHLDALNEIYLGHPSHQSARYEITVPDGRAETQSSSGLLCGTGTGSTGWCRSAWLERHCEIRLPGATAPQLAWFVREAWPSPITGTELTYGLLGPGEALQITARHDRLVIFGDGIEGDAIALTWGQQATLRVAERKLMSVSVG